MSFSLPNFLHAGYLNSLRFEMGAPLTESFKAKTIYRPIDLPIAERLREDGIDVRFDELKILDDGTLAYKGFRVLLYIRDIANYGDRQTMPKYHLSYCRTLEMMQRNKRFQRYVVANRDDGFFNVNMMEATVTPKVLQLNVCQNCLNKISWGEFRNNMDQSERANQVSTFNLKDFFEKYARDLISVTPSHNSDTAPINDYTEDWGDISERVKSARGYKCEKVSCGIQLTQRDSKYLHVHHEDGAKYNNNDRNLKVLCIRCHADEPMHGHMKQLPDYINFISR